MTTIKGFPLDSVVTGIAQNGLPEYSNKYHSVDYRRVINSLVSDGVIANTGQSLKVRVKPGESATGEIAHFQVQPGSAVLQGAFAHVDNNLDFTISAPFVNLDYSLATQNYFVGIRVNTIDNNDPYESAEVVTISGSIKNGSSSAVDPAVGSNFLALARVIAKTVKNSNGSYTYSYTLQDLRASNLCGWSAPFAEIDTSAYYEAVQDIVNKAQIEVGNEISALVAATESAIELTQNALDETLAGNLDNRIDVIEAGVPAYLSPVDELPANANLANYVESGSYFCKKSNVNSLIDRPLKGNVIDGPGEEFNSAAALYVSRLEPTSGGSEHVFQTFVSMTSKVCMFNRLIVIDHSNNTKSATAWIEVLTGKVGTNNIEDKSITKSKLDQSLQDAVDYKKSTAIINDKISAFKRGPACTMRIWGYNFSTSDPLVPGSQTQRTIGTVPEGYRPTCITCITFTNNTHRGYVGLDGNIVITTGNIPDTLFGSATYVLV